MSKLHLGLSGFDYKEWQGEGLFYPPTVKRAGYLQHYSSRMNSLELNGTHQSLPSEASVERWIHATPDSFTFSPKMHQRVTHFTRLKPEGWETLNVFVERLEPMEKAGKLGPILVQLPPNFKRDDARLATFLEQIPHRPTLRWAFEFRSDSWNTPEVEDILRTHNAAWAYVETDEDDPRPRDIADFFFARMRRMDYTDDQLKGWALLLRARLDAGRDCFVYCRHKDTVAPWKWADRLRELVG